MGATSLCPLWSLLSGQASLILRQSVTDETVACRGVLFSTTTTAARSGHGCAWWWRASVLRFRDPPLGSGPSPIQIMSYLSYPLFLRSAILNPLDVWRLHQEANWAFIISDFWEIAPRQEPGCEIIFNDVHLITREVFFSSHAACNSRHVWTRDRQSN